MAQPPHPQLDLPDPAVKRQQTLRLTSPADPDPLEAVHQELLFRMAALYESEHPELRLLFAVPNGGHRAKATALAMKRQGQKPGVPDMILPVARGGWHSLWIELKREHEGQPSDEQKAWIVALQAAGHRAIVCFGWQSAWREIVRYLSLPATVPTVMPPDYNPLPRRGAKE